MRFSISSSALSSRLTTLAKVVNSKNSLPILDSFLFEVHNGELTITASDSENVMRTTLALDSCDGEGNFAVNNHTILDAVKELAEQPLAIDINYDEWKMYVTYQNGSYNFPVQNADEFPRAQAVSEGATTIVTNASILNDNVLTFLNRATKVELGTISTHLIRAYYEKSFRSIGIKVSDEILDRAALATRGFPYLMQLIGYYVIQYTPTGDAVTEAIMEKVEKAAMGDMEDNVFKPILAPLSDNDKLFLKAMARIGGTVTTAKLQAALGENGPAIQPYRKRLIEAGVIEAPRRGELVFAMPYLSEYFLNELNESAY